MKGLVAGLLALMVGGCGSSSGGGNAQALCREGTQAVCDKVYDCAEGEPLRQFLGATKADCAAGLNTERCGSATGCEPGQTYHADQAQACLDAIKAVTCSQLTSPTSIMPAACSDEAICTGTTTQ